MKLYRIKNRQSFGFSAENPTGQKNGGTKGKDCEKLSVFRLLRERLLRCVIQMALV